MATNKKPQTFGTAPPGHAFGSLHNTAFALRVACARGAELPGGTARTGGYIVGAFAGCCGSAKGPTKTSITTIL